MAINTAVDQEPNFLPGDLMQSRARTKLEKLIADRRIKALTINDLRQMGDLWPEDQNVDDFISAVRQWRSEGPERTLL